VTSVATSLTELADRAITPIAGKGKISIGRSYASASSPPRIESQGMVIGTAGLFRYKKAFYLFKALAEIGSRFDYSILLPEIFQ
jgi:hypothetical protein